MKPTLVPEGGTKGDVLAVRYRNALDKLNGGRAQWIEGTLELAVVVTEAKEEWPGNAAFSRWLYQHNLEPLHPNDRAALLGFARGLKAARKMLEESQSTSWRTIWEKQPKRAPTKIGKSASGKKSGAQYKKYVPAVMREDLPPPPPRIASLKGVSLTREQVDPDFKGDAIQFATEYGHVLLHTKAEIAERKRQDGLQEWLGVVADHARTAQAVLAAAPADPAALREWQRKAAKAEKLKAWRESIQAAAIKVTPST